MLVAFVPVAPILLAAYLFRESQVADVVAIVAGGLVCVLALPFVDAATIAMLRSEKRTGWGKILGDRIESRSQPHQ